MKPWLNVSLLTLLLAGCSTQTPSTSSVPVTSSKTQLVEIQFTGAGTPNPTSSLRVLGSAGIGKQALTEATDLSFSYRGSEAFTSDDGTTRYLQVHYLVTNTSGQTYHNLGFLPVVISDTDGNSGNNSTTPTLEGTPFKSVKYYDGTSAPLSTAEGLTPTYAKRFNTTANLLQNLITDSTYRSGLDVTGFDVTDPAGLEVTEVKNEGWKFQDPLATGESRVITFSVSFPIPSDRKLAPYSFTLMAAYTDGISDLDFYGSDLTVDSTRTNQEPDIALDSSGAPIVVWDENPTSESSVSYVKRWNGTTWDQLGTTLGSADSSFTTYASIAVNQQDQPMVSYIQYPSIYVKQWDGTTWTQLGDTLTNDSIGAGQDMAVNSQGQPIVAYVEYASGYNAQVKQWNGTTWTQLGGNLRVNSSGAPNEVAMAVGPNNRPVVALAELLSGQRNNLYVKQWNGITWTQLGDTLDVTLTNGTFDADVAVDSNNQPVVVWCEVVEGQGCNLYVKRWDGSAWQQLGSELDLNLINPSLWPTVKINSQDQPVVFFTEERVLYSKTWDGSSWVQGTTSYSLGSGNASMPAFVLDEDTPVVTWSENNRIYVKR